MLFRSGQAVVVDVDLIANNLVFAGGKVGGENFGGVHGLGEGVDVYVRRTNGYANSYIIFVWRE